MSQFKYGGNHRRDSILSRVNFIELGYVRLSGHFTTYVLYSVHTLHGTRRCRGTRTRPSSYTEADLCTCMQHANQRSNPHGWGQSSDH